MSETTARAGHVTGVVLGLSTLLTLLLVAFAWPASELAPRGVPVAVAGPTPAVEQVTAGLGEALGADALDVSAVGSRSEAVAAIEDREVYGAIVLSPDGAEVLTASAASPAVAQLLGEVGSRLGEASGSPVTVTDVVALPEDDPRGAVFGAGAFPLVLGGLATALVLSLRVAGRWSRVVGALGVAVVAGSVLAAVLQYWFGALEGSYLANAGVVALAITAMALMLVGLGNVLGLAGLGIGAATVLLLGNPLSGITSAPELLPSGWSTLGQLLPPGAVGTALRSTAFFDGAGAMWPLVVLTAWAALGLVMTLVPAERLASRSAVRRTDAAVPPAPAVGKV